MIYHYCYYNNQKKRAEEFAKREKERLERSKDGSTDKDRERRGGGDRDRDRDRRRDDDRDRDRDRYRDRDRDRRGKTFQ